MSQHQPKPAILPPIFENMPEPLTGRPQWVVWRGQWLENGRLNKVPYDPKQWTHNASSTNPATWSSFEAAKAAYAAGKFDGVGFVVTAEDNIVGGDGDHVVSDGVLDPDAQSIVEKIDTYAEISPTGTGFRFFAFGSLRGLADRKHGQYEVYDSGRFLTVTGHRIGNRATIEERQEALEAFHAQRIARKPSRSTTSRTRTSSPTSTNLSDQDLMDRMLASKSGAALSALLSGDTSAHGDDDSAADLALCGHLAFWTGSDASRMDRMFRASGLMRDKWERDDYRERTIRKAIEGCSEHYEPGIAQGAVNTRARDAASPAEPWQPPIPLSHEEVEPFPLEVLPPALSGIVQNMAAGIKVPVDMPAMFVLSVVSAAVARRYKVQVGSTHAEPTNLYVAVVAEPGSRKSAIIPLVAPLREYERDLTEHLRPIIEAAKAEAEFQQQRIRHLRDKAARSQNPDEQDGLRQEAAELAAKPRRVPPQPRLLVDDITQQALATVMSEQVGTMAVFSAEGGIFGILAGLYSDGKPNLDLFLKAHAGEEYRVDRVGRPPEFIASACLTVGLLVQPDVLDSLSRVKAFRGRGLLARFLYSIPEDMTGSRDYAKDWQPDEADQAAYNAAVRAILETPPADPGDLSKRYVLTIRGDALDIWAEHYNDVEHRQAIGRDLREMRDWASKLAGAAARIAGCLHLVEHAGSACPWTLPIAPKTVAAAWAIAEYLIPHAQAAFSLMGADPVRAQAEDILGWLRRIEGGEFSMRDCHQAFRRMTPAELLPSIDLLCDHGYLRLKPSQGSGPQGGRPQSPVYEVNPSVKHAASVKPPFRKSAGDDRP